MAEGVAGTKPLAATAAALPALLAVLAAGEAAAADCPTPVAHLVSVVGEVRVNGELPMGTLPAVPVCPGDTVEVGPDSRAGAYLLDADTPLQLDEDTLGRFQPPPEPGSGLVELFRGAVYFLSEVRRTLTIRTPYVTAGVEGTEVYLRAGRPGSADGAELLVLEGRVAVTPGERTPALAAQAATTGERIAVRADGGVRRTALPGGEGTYAALRRVAVGELSWTLFYPDVLVAGEARPFPRIAEAARLLAAGQVAEAEAVLADVRGGNRREAALRDALRSTVAFARKDAAEAARLAEAGRTAAPDAATPLVALSYARQLGLDLDGALAAAGAAAEAAPRSPLPHARLAELRLMQGETRAARREARAATDLGGGPLADIALGYAELAALRGGAAEAAFRAALAAESANPLALLGLGLARIKQGHLEEGRRQIENAVAHDPSSSLLRSYLGKGYFEERRDDPAGKQYAIAKDLDPTDPTPWFYDAIRKQLDNRPVEALRDLERSIALNDNRAPFRSRLLLDDDRAARGTSLAQIYNDLDFQQLGINELARSLATDPTNSGAHRSVANLYLGRPRLEAARLSEQLQAQLLQPVGRNPVQPSLASSDLGWLQNSGPSHVDFNEYTSLFERNGLQLDTTTVGGSDRTIGNETAITGLLGRFSFSLGNFLYATNGTRQNDDLQNSVQTAFVQAALTEDADLQAGYIRRSIDKGDRERTVTRELDPEADATSDQNLFLLGGKFRLSSSDTILVAGLHQDSEARRRTFAVAGDASTRIRNEQDFNGDQVEVQYLHDGGRAATVAGAGGYTTDGVFRTRFGQAILGQAADAVFENDRDGGFSYVYGYGALRPDLNLTAGLGFETYDRTRRRDTRLLPKVGLVWSPRRWLDVRAAAFDVLKRGSLDDRSLEPTQIAGFSQVYDEYAGTRARTIALGVDVRPTRTVALGIEAMHREISPPVDDNFVLTGDATVLLQEQKEDWLRAYLYATPSDRIALSGAAELIRFARRKRESEFQPSRVHEFRLPLSISYFHPNGLFGRASATYIRQRTIVELQESSEFYGDETDSSLLSLDAAIGYRIAPDRVALAIEVYNLLDQDIDYQDALFRTPPEAKLDEQPSQLFFENRSFLARLTVRF